MELSYLEEFIVFSRYLSIAETARQLHVSPPALSHHLTALEREFGVALINHETPLTLTRAGKKLVEQANKIKDLLSETYEEVRTIGQTTCELKIALPTMTNLAPRFYLDRFITNFAKENPQVQVKTVRLVEDSVSKAFRDDSIDCVGAIIYPLDEDLEAGIRFEKIPGSSTPLVLWVDKRNPLASITPLRWGDIGELKMPAASNYSRLSHASSEQLLRKHGVRITRRVSGEELSDFMHSYQPDEVSLFDISSADSMYCKLDTSRICKPIDEPDAVGNAYLAFRPNATSPALELLRDYLAAKRAE